MGTKKILTKKRALAFVLTIIMILGMVPTNAIAAEATDPTDAAVTETTAPTGTVTETAAPTGAATETTASTEAVTTETTVSTEAVETVQYGTVATYTGGAISGNGEQNVNVTITETTLQWSAATDDHAAGWWVGIKVTAPADLTEEELTAATYGVNTNGQGDTWETKSFWTNKDGNYYIQLWFEVSGDALDSFKGQNRNLTMKYLFNWNGKGDRNQEITFSVVPSDKIVLLKDGEQVYPIEYGTVSTYTGGEVTGNNTANVNVKITEATLQWIAADGVRPTDGWWVGIKVTAPADLTEEELTAATYGVNTNGQGDTWETKSFWTNKDGNYYIQLWFAVDKNSLETFATQNCSLTMMYKFDWNGKGDRNQVITFSLVPSDKIVLMKDGEQVYPVNYGTVETYTGGAVSGNGTNAVTVEITETTLQYSEATANHAAGWWVGINVVAPTDLTAEKLQKATYGVNNDGTGENWETKSFWSNKDTDRSIQLWFLVTPESLAKGKNLTMKYLFNWNGEGDRNQEITFTLKPSDAIVLMKDGEQAYPLRTVTFAAPAKGYFADADGVQLADNKMTVVPGSDAKFTLVDVEGYNVKVLVGDEELTAAADGVYTVKNVTENQSVTVEMEDVTAPVIGEVKVPGDWATSKKISVTATDNSGVVSVYVSKATKYETLEEVQANAAAAAKNEETGKYEYTAVENGSYYVYAVDESGNMTAKAEAVEVKKIDTTAPTLVIDPVNVWPYDTKYTITVSDVNGSGIRAVYCSTTDTGVELQTLAEYEGDYPETATVEFKGSRSETYYFFVYDSAGNTSDNRQNPETPGTVEFGDIVVPETWVKDEYTVKFTATNALTVSWSDKEDAWPWERTEIEPQNGVYSFTVDENGTYHIFAVDDEGEPTQTSVKIDYIDTEVPTISVSKNPDTDWTNDAVTISGTVSDSQSGIGGTEDSIGRVEYSTTKEGTYTAADYNEENGTYTITTDSEFNGTYYIRAVDNVGNASVVKEVEVQIDKTKPVITSATYSGMVDNSFLEDALNVLSFDLVFKDSVLINVEAVDVMAEGSENDKLVSGIARYEYKLVPDGADAGELWNTHKSTDGETTIHVTLPDGQDSFIGQIYVRVVDNAENYSDSTAVEYDAEGGQAAKDIVVDNVTPAAPEVNLDGCEAGKWTNQDVTITLSGSDTASGINAYEYKTDSSDWQKLVDGDQKATDTLTISTDTNETYYFRAVSNSGINGHVTNGIDIKVQKKVPTDPKVTIAEPNGENDWYVGERPTIEIEPYVPLENHAEVTTYYKLWETDQTEPKDEEKKTLTAESYPKIEADGIYNFKVWTVDEAGNTSGTVSVEKIKVDITNPADLKIWTEKSDGEVLAESIMTDDITFENFFYQHEIVVKMAAQDETSGNVVIQYQMVATATDYNPNGPWETYSEAGIAVAPSKKFIIYFRATDAAGNVIEKHSDGVVVDNQKPEGIEGTSPEIYIDPVKPNVENWSGIYKMADLDPLNPVVTVNLAAVDPGDDGFYSGLSMITYRVYTTDSGADSGTKVLLDATDTKNLEDKLTTGTDKLIKAWADSITIDPETFNSNNVYVTVTATDNAGNERSSTSGPIKIDVTKPTINVKYEALSSATNNNEGVYPDGKGTGYYKDKREATITITERNFDSTKVTIQIKKDGTDFSGYKISDSWTPGTTGDETVKNGDNNTHTATITYDEDGVYEFNISYSDAAGNAAIVEYEDGTENANKFTIDKTQPTISVTYDNNDVENDKYFKATRTATIRITEHNFDADRVTVTINSARGGKNIDKPTFTREGETDVYKATVTYDVDGDYTFDVTMTDKAGNNSPATNYGNSAAARDFVVDTTYEDMITIGGVENGKAYGYGSTVIPTIDISDINLDEYTVTLIGVQKDTTIDLTDRVNALLDVDDENVSGSFDIFEAVQGMDGIYTLSVTSLDKAGNEDAAEVTFTVNRFGSVYVYDEYLNGLIADGGAYVLDVTDDLIIVEYNADKLVSDSLVIEITCDGKPLENVIYEVTPEINDKVAVGESGWYQYRYTISKDNFASDGVYKISVSSKDATGNNPENNHYEDMGIAFRVDSTLPEISSVVGLEEAIINATEVEVKYTVYDTMGIKSIKIYVDGELVDEITDFSADLNNYGGSFMLNEKSSAQSVRIVVEDMAGNITDTDAEDFSSAYVFNKSVTVSTNIFVRWYANKPLFWGSIGGAVVLIGGLWFFIVAKRKKKEEEEATAK